jgi:hypothetical protein
LIEHFPAMKMPPFNAARIPPQISLRNLRKLDAMQNQNPPRIRSEGVLLRNARQRGSTAVPLHNRNRPSEGLKNPQTGGFFEASRRAPCGVVNNSD